MSVEALINFVETLARRSPVLALALAVGLVLPLMAVFAFAGRGMLALARGRSNRDAALLPDAAITSVTPWPTDAHLLVDHGMGLDHVHAIAVGSSPLRIGCDVDNDIALTSQCVDRFHAIVSRDADRGYSVMDLSGPGGGGVRVNGGRVAMIALVHGDSIEVGTARLRFVGKPV